MNPSRILPLAALVVAVFLTACGGGSSDAPTAADAKAAYAPVQTKIKGLGTDIGAAVAQASSATDAELATQFDALADRGRAQKAEIDAVEVPDSLVAERNALRDALDKGTDDLTDIATASKASDAAAARTAAEKLISDSEQIREARDAFGAALAAEAKQ